MYLVLSILSALSPGSAIIAYPLGQVHTTDAIVDLKGGEVGRCHSVEERERARNEMHQSISSIITTLAETATTTVTTMTTTAAPMTTTAAPVTTTAAPMTTTAAPVTTTVAPMTTMAPMTTTAAPGTTTAAPVTTTTTPTTTSTYTCNGTPGWRRIAFINMTDTSYICPTGLSLTSYSKRTCGRSHTTYGGCSSTTFSVGGLSYSQVCGRIRGYQFGATNAFLGSYYEGIDSYYVDGVSLTHGSAGRRQHIWTFAVGGSEVVSSWPDEDCPCDTGYYDHVPTFVGNNYFCESGLHSARTLVSSEIFYPDDVLWDGQNCTSTSTCCQLNNPPWFTKTCPVQQPMTLS